MKVVRQFFKTKRTLRAVDELRDVHCGVGDTQNVFMFAMAGWNAVEVWKHHTDEELIQTLRLVSYYLMMVELNKLYHMAFLLDAALIRAVTVPRYSILKKVLHLPHMI